MRPPSLESVVFIAQHTVDHSGATLPEQDNAESLFGDEDAIRPDKYSIFAPGDRWKSKHETEVAMKIHSFFDPPNLSRRSEEYLGNFNSCWKERRAEL